MPSKAGPDLIVARFKLPMILQSETAECGLACIAMIAGYFGRATTLRELRGQFAVSLKGATLKTLIQIASALGMDARAVRLELDELADLHCPAILHWQFDHFVVLERLDRRGRALIHNPAVVCGATVAMN